MPCILLLLLFSILKLSILHKSSGPQVQSVDVWDGRKKYPYLLETVAQSPAIRYSKALD